MQTRLSSGLNCCNLSSHRLWLSLLFLLIPVACVLTARMMPELDANFRSWFIAASLILGVLLQLVWFLFFSRFSIRARLLGLAVLALLAVTARYTLKVAGTVNGTGLPKITWRWANDRANPPSAPVTTTSDTQDSILNAIPAGSGDVPQFFGPNRNGLISTEFPLADWQSTPPKQIWRIPVGSGWSGFAVVGGRAFTQEQRGAQELVTCYELLTGKLIWSHADQAHFTQWQGGEGPRATPTITDGRVYTYGATGILNCLDAASGKKGWSVNVLSLADSGNLEWGVSSSPLVYDNKVVVTGGKAAGPVLFAFDNQTGDLVWKAGHDQASYSSPLLGNLGGRRVLLSNNSTSLTLHDPETGTVLAEHTWGDARWPKASQPVLLPDDRIFLSAGYGMGCQMLRVKPGPDAALQIEELWRGLKMKTQFNSAAFDGQYIYGMDDGRMVCIDPANGERLWKEGRYGSGQSLTIAGGLTLIQSERGPVVLGKSTPESYQELGSIEALDSKTWNHPTLAGKYLLVRNDREAVCYELPLRDAPGQ